MSTSNTCSVPALSLPSTDTVSAPDQAASTTSTSRDSTRMGASTTIRDELPAVRMTRARRIPVRGPRRTTRTARVPSREGMAAISAVRSAQARTR